MPKDLFLEPGGQTYIYIFFTAQINGSCPGKEGVKWEKILARGEGVCEELLPIKLYCVIPTKQRQKDKSELPTFIYN